jgi:hypothetical protein
MPFISLVVIAALLRLDQAASPAALKTDVDRLAQAAEQLTGRWPSQAPLPVPEVRLVARHGRKELEPWLTHDDRHLRGNVAFVLARLGDPRGLEAIAEILADRAAREPGQGIPSGKWSSPAQIRADRYHAAHLFGDLDRRGVDLLIPLLEDADVQSIVPRWPRSAIGAQSRRCSTF